MNVPKMFMANVVIPANSSSADAGGTGQTQLHSLKLAQA
jgi:hypothetical protein